MLMNTTDFQPLTELHLGHFSEVDASGQSDQFIAFLDRIEQMPSSSRLRERSYDLLRVEPGNRVIDVGCGTGRAVAELHERSLVATGVDSSHHMIDEAERRYPDCEFRQASAECLPFDAATLRGYRAEWLYGHLHQPQRALAEAFRVLAPDGRIVLVDIENDLRAIDADDRPLTRRLTAAFAESVANPWVGRSARGLLLEAGFVDVEVELHANTLTDYSPVIVEQFIRPAIAQEVVGTEEAAEWIADQRHRGKTNRFFAVMLKYVVSALRRS